MPQQWNARSDAVLEAGAVAQGLRGSEPQSLMLHAAATAGALWLARSGPVWLPAYALEWAGEGYADVLLGALGYSSAAVISLRMAGLIYLRLGKTAPRTWEKNLKDSQKMLLGLPRTPPPQAPPAPAAPKRAEQPPTPPLGPPLTQMPLRAPAAASPATPAATAAGAGREEGYVGSPAVGSGGPLSGAQLVSTPEQLRRYMDAFEEDAAAPDQMAAGYAPFGAAAAGAPAFGGFQASPAAGGALGPAPTYRPSLQPRGKAGSPHFSDGRLARSSAEVVSDALQRLRVTPAGLHAWTEQLRLWLAADLLQPLMRLLDGAHAEVARHAAQLGLAVALAPVGAEAGAAARAGAGAASSAAAETDDDVLAAQLRAHLTSALRGPAHAHTAAAFACLEAVHRYQRLGALLRGEAPRALLQAVPRGYVAARARALAEGPCLAAFRWAGGGGWGGKPWSVELPTDSALLLYLFAAFLEAPKWHFTLDEAGGAAAAGVPLYVGALPARPPPAYAAILSFRPTTQARPAGASAVLGLGLATAEPHFTLVQNGEPALTLSSPSALFHVLLLFLQARPATADVKLNSGGLLGGRTLDYLRLSAVLQADELILSLLRGIWFGLW